jgi:hypothetical protein
MQVHRIYSEAVHRLDLLNGPRAQGNTQCIVRIFGVRSVMSCTSSVCQHDHAIACNRARHIFHRCQGQRHQDSTYQTRHYHVVSTHLCTSANLAGAFEFAAGPDLREWADVCSGGGCGTLRVELRQSALIGYLWTCSPLRFSGAVDHDPLPRIRSRCTVAASSGQYRKQCSSVVARPVPYVLVCRTLLLQHGRGLQSRCWTSLGDGALSVPL